MSSLRILQAALITLSVSAIARADLFTFQDLSGLSAEAEFNLLGPQTLEIRLKNTSTGVPASWTDGSNQILTVLSWDFGQAGSQGGDPAITGGSVLIGPQSQTVNFDAGSFGPGTDVSGEFGYGNGGGSGSMTNFFGALRAQTTAFGGTNLDGPSNLNGPQGGLVADPMTMNIGGLGGIQDEVIATLTLSGPINSLDFLYDNGLQVEFGSDAAFLPGIVAPPDDSLPVPVPGSTLLAFIGLTLLVPLRRKRPIRD